MRVHMYTCTCTVSLHSRGIRPTWRHVFVHSLTHRPVHRVWACDGHVQVRAAAEEKARLVAEARAVLTSASEREIHAQAELDACQARLHTHACTHTHTHTHTCTY